MDGSGFPWERANEVAAGIPIAVSSNTNPSDARNCWWGVSWRASAHQASTVTAEVQVPGPGRKCPRPAQVAISHAVRLAFSWARELAGALVGFTSAGGIRLAFSAPGALFSLLDGVQVYHLVIWAYGRGDHVCATSPLPQIDEPATLAAKGELLLVFQHNGLAGWTSNAACAFSYGGLAVRAGARCARQHRAGPSNNYDAPPVFWKKRISDSIPR